jgi:hypothetical protein
MERDSESRLPGRVKDPGPSQDRDFESRLRLMTVTPSQGSESRLRVEIRFLDLPGVSLHADPEPAWAH